MTDVMKPDERTLRADLNSVPFQSQINLRWGEPKVDWPFVYVWVKARPTESGVDHYWLRLDCSDYPQRAPTATFWDMEVNLKLEDAKRPWGIGEVGLAFRTDWPGDPPGSGGAFYLPCDRIALEGHADWPEKHSRRIWKPEKGVIYYLDEVTRLLDSQEYTGPRGPVS